MHVWMRQGEAFKPENTILNAKQSGGSIMMWDCFAGYGTSILQKRNGSLFLCQEANVRQNTKMQVMQVSQILTGVFV